MHVAPAKGWPAGTKPTSPEGRNVTAFATGLEHPRWLYVLPNGDVLVAETNAPPKPEDGKGIKGWVMKLVHEEGRRGRAERRTASPCCATPTATAWPRRARVFLEGLQLAVRHGARRRRPLRRQHRRGRALSLPGRAQTHRRAPAARWSICPAGPRNHHWTKNLIASRRRLEALRRPSARTATSPRTASRPRKAAPRSGRSTRKTGAHRVFADRACATRTASPGSRRPARCGPSSTSATSSATTSCPTT